MDRQVDQVVAGHVEAVQTEVDEKGQVADHPSPLEQLGERGGHLLQEDVAADHGQVVEVEGSRKGVGVGGQADEHDDDEPARGWEGGGVEQGREPCSPPALLPHGRLFLHGCHLLLAPFPTTRQRRSKPGNCHVPHDYLTIARICHKNRTSAESGEPPRPESSP